MKEIILEGEDFYKKRDTLKEVRKDVDNWLTYYIDEKTNDKWVKEHPFGAMQAGGPPQLRLIQKFPWEE